MKLSKKNMIYVWAMFFIWAVSIFLLCEFLPPGHLTAVMVTFVAGFIPVSLLIWHYKTDEGKKEIKEAEEAHATYKAKKRLKWYHYLFREGEGSNSDDVGFIPMN